MQQKVSKNNLYCFSVLVHGALEANKATGKKRSLRINNIKSVTNPVKTLRETRKLKETLIPTSLSKFRVATVIVQTLVVRNADVTETVGRRKVDVVALQEKRFRNEEVKRLREDCIGKELN